MAAGLAVFAGVILLVSVRGVTGWLHGGRVAGADAGFFTGTGPRCDQTVTPQAEPPDGTITSRQPSLSNHADAHAAIIGHSRSVIFAAHDMPVSSVSA